MDFGSKVFPFFVEEEATQNGLLLMYMAQKCLFERMNAEVSDDNKLDDEQFFMILHNSPKLRSILRNTVLEGMNSIDWEHCYDTSLANSLKIEEDIKKHNKSNID